MPLQVVAGALGTYLSPALFTCYEIQRVFSLLNHSLLLLLFSRSVTYNSAAPHTAAGHTPLSMGFPRGEYWSCLTFPCPGHLSDPGIEPVSPARPLSHLGSANHSLLNYRMGSSARWSVMTWGCGMGGEEGSSRRRGYTYNSFPSLCSRN